MMDEIFKLLKTLYGVTTVMALKEAKDVENLEKLIKKSGAVIDDDHIADDTVWSSKNTNEHIADVSRGLHNILQEIGVLNNECNDLSTLFRRMQNTVNDVQAEADATAILANNNTIKILDVSNNVDSSILTLAQILAMTTATLGQVYDLLITVNNRTIDLAELSEHMIRSVGTDQSGYISWGGIYPDDYSVVDAVKSVAGGGGGGGAAYKINYKYKDGKNIASWPLDKNTFISPKLFSYPVMKDDVTRHCWEVIDLAEYVDASCDVTLNRIGFEDNNQTVFGTLYDNDDPGKYWLEYVPALAVPTPDLYTLAIGADTSIITSQRFSECPNLTYVTLSDTVEMINYRAFYNCQNIREINMPAQLKLIGAQAFYYNKKIGEFSLPDTVSFIGQGAFEKCYKMKEFTVPAELERIEDETFKDCTSLLNIIFTDNSSINWIGAKAFACCKNLREFIIPDTIKYIGDEAFSECVNLTSITIPALDTSLVFGSGLFKDCQNLSDINMLDASLMYLPDEIFKGCTALESVLLPESCRVIGYSCFENCQMLSEIIWSDGICEIGGSAFKGCARLEELIIPERITTIGNSAFAADTSLRSIVFRGALERLPDSCFTGCTELENIEFVTDYQNKISSFNYIGDRPFENCPALTDEMFAKFDFSNLVSISNSAFKNSANLTTVNLTNANYQFNYLPDSMFANCPNLTNVIIPSNVQIIGISCFENDTSLTSISLPLKMYKIKDCAFQGCTNLTNIVWPTNLYSLSSYCFCNTGLTSVTVPDTSSTDYYSMKGLFKDCKELTSVIWNNETCVGENCFENCSNLTSFTYQKVGSSWSSSRILQRAFYECTNLATFEVPSRIYELSSETFYKTHGKKMTITLRYEGVVTCYENTFNPMFIEQIRVPSGYVNSYKNSSVFGLFADKIVGY